MSEKKQYGFDEFMRDAKRTGLTGDQLAEALVARQPMEASCEAAWQIMKTKDGVNIDLLNFRAIWLAGRAYGTQERSSEIPATLSASSGPPAHLADIRAIGTDTSSPCDPAAIGLTHRARSVIQAASDAAHKVLIAGGDYGDELDDKGLRGELKHARDALRSLLETVSTTANTVPEGFVLVPIQLNADMRDVLSEEDWTWEDLLVAANSVTEEQYYAIQRGDEGSPAAVQPVADEREGK